MRGADTASNRRGSGLSIGGTGMLAAATRWISRRCPTTLVVSRHASRFVGSDPRMSALDADWSEPDFLGLIETRLAAIPPVDLALLWLHRPDQHLPALSGMLGGARVVLVLGSTDGQPGLPGAADIVTVRLGSMAAAGGRRWLTHDEISAGAIAALDDGGSRIVGALLPLR